MKRISAAIISIILLFSLSACAFTDILSGKDEQYVPSGDIEVTLTHVTDKAKVVTRRITDKALTGIDLVCVYFDANGNQIDRYQRVECSFTTEGKLSIWTFDVPDGCVYMDAAVAEVRYADATEHTCPGISAWVSQSVKTFTLEKQSRIVEKMAQNAAAAQTCEALTYSVDTPQDNALNLKLKNVGSQEITSVMITLLWFDKDGAPVDMGGALVANSEKVSAKDLSPEKEAVYTVTAPAGAAFAKAVIQEVSFADGTTWENDYIYEWSIANWNKAQ